MEGKLNVEKFEELVENMEMIRKEINSLLKLMESVLCLMKVQIELYKKVEGWKNGSG